MYHTLLIIHSYWRWVVLISLLLAIYKSYFGWKKQLNFNKNDNLLRHLTATILHIQLILGLMLYSLSPLVKYFYQDFIHAIHLREIRFFGMEHIFAMIISITIITIGSIKANRKLDDNQKFKTMFWYYLIGLLLIFTSIPWAFSPLVSRPLFRN